MDEDQLFDRAVRGALGRRERDQAWAELHRSGRKLSYNKIAQGTRTRLLALGLSEEEIDRELGVGPDNVRRAVSLVRAS